MRWKAHLYENSGLNPSNPLNYIFKSRKCSPEHKDLIQFESDLLELIKSVKFKKVKNKFLDQLHKKNVFIFADKTREIYETDKNTSKKLLTDNISKTYKKTEYNIYNKINKEAKTIANNYGVSGRVDCLAKSNAFVSLKDHKPNFSLNPNCRLINPAKSEMGKISKYFLEQLNSKLRDLPSANQWQETSTLINWFKNVKNKKKCTFMQFDIEEFYPSISKELILKSITYAKTLVNTSDEEINTIMHSRIMHSLLFNNTAIWIKKNGDPDFDVTMGSFDGAELCELVGLCIVHILCEKYGKQRIGLYRHDGLACFGYTSGPQADRIRKDFIKIFKEDFDLSITCETNLKAVNFLDVTLNLTTGKYQPYNKPDNNPLYINILSNHPPNIIKNLPDNISKRINTLSADETTFNKFKDLYNNALAESGF